MKCKVCATNYFITSNKGACVINCSLANEYTNSFKNKCVTNCHAEDVTYYLSTDGINCVKNCNTGEYKTGGICKLCSDTLNNCSTCNSDATLCLSCVSGFYLTFTSNGCIDECKEAGHYLNSAGTKCVSNCITDDNSILDVNNL